MIISTEQARLAARSIEQQPESAHGNHAEVSAELMSRIALALEATPEMRLDRVDAACQRMETGAPDSQTIAEMIIARAICDALR